MSDCCSSFFSRATHCRPAVLHTIEADCAAMMAAGFNIRLTTWGSTQQERLCVFGGIPCEEHRFPVQIWITHQYPIDPPQMYLVAPSVAHSEKYGEVVVTPEIVVGHPNLDHTGRCYSAALSNWSPYCSSLSSLICTFTKEIEKNGFPIINRLASSLSAHTTPSASCIVCCHSVSKAVLVPCGHSCCCYSCASNLPNCPVCRKRIEFPQLICEDW